jgi:type IV pilus assembly protein PilY1
MQSDIDHKLIVQLEIIMKSHRMLNRFARALLTLFVAGLVPGWVCMGNALAATTDVAAGPIFTNATATTEVKPNVMFVLDDSGSMDWDYMPDDANNFSGNYGFPSSQCNGVYYNPAITYSPPVDATGTSYSNSSFTSAWKDGYNIGSGTTNLSTSFKANSNDTAQAAYYYVYSGAQTTAKQKDYYNTNSIFYKECNSIIGSTTKVDGTNAVNTLFTKKTVSATSGPGGTDERTNFANWYSYDRTRMLMMKTASGQAFKTLSNHFRVGFMTIDNNASPAFLNIADFDSTQKSSWYTKLYSSVANNSTPLREALANVGRMYAGQVTSLNGTT